LEVRGSDEFEGAFKTAVGKRADALLVRAHPCSVLTEKGLPT
jgi:hypothetical protein